MIDWIKVCERMPELVKTHAHYGSSIPVLILVNGKMITTAIYEYGITIESAVAPMWSDEWGTECIEFNSVSHWAEINFPKI